MIFELAAKTEYTCMAMISDGSALVDQLASEECNLDDRAL